MDAPWKTGEAQHFWQYYLQPVSPGSFEAVTPEMARKYFVPLRAPSCAQVATRSGVQGTLEGFCFPHGLGVLATLHLRPDEPLPLLVVDYAFQACHADFGLTWKIGEDATHGDLCSLADKIIERLLAKVLDGAVPRGKPLSSPLTIATIIDADGVRNSTASKVPSGLDLALTALCQLQPEHGEMQSLRVPPR